MGPKISMGFTTLTPSTHVEALSHA